MLFPVCFEFTWKNRNVPLCYAATVLPCPPDDDIWLLSSLPLFILGHKEVLLLSFYRRVAQLHWAKEISFRFHQQFVRNQDFKSNPILLPAESHVRIPLPWLSFQAWQEHSAGAGLSHSTTSALPSSLHAVPHNPSLISLLTSSQESL